MVLNNNLADPLSSANITKISEHYSEKKKRLLRKESKFNQFESIWKTIFRRIANRKPISWYHIMSSIIL